MKPNVLLLCVDDMNDWAGCLGGYPGVSTPNIDRLAERGTLFTNAHCPSSVCNPSRTAILTGMRPSRSGVYDNQQWWRPAHPAVVTLPERFRRAGFETAGAGKIFHHTDGFNPPDQWVQYFRQVFDDPWDRGAHHGVATAPAPPGHPLNGITPYEHEFDWGVLGLPESEYGDVRAADWAIGFLQRRAAAAAQREPERPFLLACGLFRPHLPCYAPRRYFDRYPLERIKLPGLMDSDLERLPPVGAELAANRRNCYQKVIDHDRWAEAVQAYLATISFADAQIGRVLGALDECGLTGNTVVVFYSDNGFHLGEKRHWHKSTLWERATHVPFVIAGPGLGTPGQRIDRPVSLQDLYPTLVDLCALPVADSERIDGDSLAPLIADPDRMWRQAALTTYLRGNHALRTERWRYIRYHDGGEELYDRDADPTEERNLAAHPEMRPLITDLRAELPASDAPNAPVKSDWSFDHDSYTWPRRDTTGCRPGRPAARRRRRSRQSSPRTRPPDAWRRAAATRPRMCRRRGCGIAGRPPVPPRGRAVREAAPVGHDQVQEAVAVVVAPGGSGALAGVAHPRRRRDVADGTEHPGAGELNRRGDGAPLRIDRR